MTKKSGVPAIRFKGFTDTWEQRGLGECVTFLDTMRKPLKESEREKGIYPYYGASGIVDYVSDYIFDEELVLLSEDGANITDRNYPVCFLASGKYWVNNHAHVLKVNGENENNFICNSLERMDFTQYNSGMAMPKLNKEVCQSIELCCPKFAEQKRIGDYFRNLDNLITLHQRKLEKLHNLKKAMLEKMFPKNGSAYPEIRFAGFTDAWEQRELGEVANNFEYGLNASAKEFDRKNKYIRITDIDDESRMFLSDDITSPDTDLTLADKYKLEAGDILFARTGASVGKTYLYRVKDGLVYYAGFLIRAKINSENDAEFVFQNTLTDSYNSFIRITSQRSGQPGVNAQEYQDFTFYLPSLREQQQIGTYFRNLDNLITLHQRKLEKLQNIKKSMLEKMFV